MTKLVNKVLVINNRRTSMRLCVSEWNALERICYEEKVNRNKLIETIENNNSAQLGLTYLTRLFTLFYYYHIVTNPEDYQTSHGTVRVVQLLNKLYAVKHEKA